MNDQPLASRLAGKKIGQWEVISKKKKDAGDNSGYWSTCYLVQNSEGQKAFMKAYNYCYAFGSEANSADSLKFMTNNFIYERDLLEICSNRKLHRVVSAIDSGEYREKNEILPVPFLVFEQADGNLKYIQAEHRPNLSWKLKLFHGSLLGISQLHSIKVAHQDIKPSNILVFGKVISKVSDLGNATQFENFSFWSGDKHQGDMRYAPIELLYNHCSKDWDPRRYGADLFMMGGLLTYLVADISFLGSLHGKLDEAHRWDQFGGSYDLALPYITKAYQETLEDISQVIPGTICDELIQIIAELCHPKPEERGNPKRVGSGVRQYSLERYVSVVDRLSKKI